MIIKKLYLKILCYFNPVKYSKKIGVNVLGNTYQLGKIDYGSEPYLVTLGDRISTSSGIHFVTHDGGTWVFRHEDKYKKVVKYGKIEVKDNCFIGMNVIILPGVTIGPNAVIGAGSIVTKDVLPNTVVAGNPAAYICSVDEYAEKLLDKLPEYNADSYKDDKRKEILRMLDGKMK